MSDRVKRNIFIAVILLVPIYVFWTPTDTYADTMFAGNGLVVADIGYGSIGDWAVSVVCDILSFLLNAVCDILNFIITVLFGADINSIIKQQSTTLGGVELSLYAFNFETNNPYGMIAAVVYAFLRLYAFAFLPINCTIALVKAILNGGSSRAFEEVKSTFYDMIIKIFLLILAPYIVDMLLTLRTSFMTTAFEQIQNVGGSIDDVMDNFINGKGNVIDSLAEGLNASVATQTTWSVTNSNEDTLLGILLSFFIRISYYGYTLYLMIIYVILSISTALWFIALPMICIRGKNFKDNLSRWFESGIGIYVTPLIDLICITIPSFINTVGSFGTSTSGANETYTSPLSLVIVVAISLWCMIPLRSTLRQFAGIADSGADALGQRTMTQVATLAFGAAKLMGNKNNANAEADEADRKADEASEMADESERYESAQNSRAAGEVENMVGDGSNGGAESGDASAVSGETDSEKAKAGKAAGGGLGGSGRAENVAAGPDGVTGESETAGEDTGEGVSAETGETSTGGSESSEVETQGAGAKSGSAVEHGKSQKSYGELEDRDAELVQEEERVKGDYDKQINEEEQAAANEDLMAEEAEMNGDSTGAEEHRNNAEQHRSNARDLSSKEQQELTEIENERKDIERQKNAVRGQSEDVALTDEELDERDAELAQEISDIEDEYNPQIEQQKKAALAQRNRADEQRAAGYEKAAQASEAFAEEHEQAAKELEQQKNEAIAPLQQERDAIADQKQSNAQERAKHPQNISESREMLNQADAESKRTVDTFKAMDEQLATRDGELSQQMQGIKSEYGKAEAEASRNEAAATRKARQATVDGNKEDANKYNLEASEYREQGAKLKQQEKEALAPLEAERASIKSQREAIKTGINEQNARQRDIAAKQKDLAAKQKSVAGATNAAYSEDSLEAEHEANMASIRQKYMTLDDFDKNGNLDSLSYGQQAELYRQRANQIRATENSRRRRSAAGAAIGGVAMSMYGPTLSVGAAIAGSAAGSASANKEGTAKMNQTLGKREKEMQSMAGDMQMASSDVTSATRTASDVVNQIRNSNMSRSEKKQAVKTVSAMEGTYGEGARMEMGGEYRDASVPLRRRENVVPFVRTMPSANANLSAPPVNVSSISSEAGSAYERIGNELNGTKAGRYATAPADSTNVMGKLRSIYERRPQPDVSVPDIDIPKPQGDVTTDYLYENFNNPSGGRGVVDFLGSIGAYKLSDSVSLQDFEHRCEVTGCGDLTLESIKGRCPDVRTATAQQVVLANYVNSAISSAGIEYSDFLQGSSDVLMGESRGSVYQFLDVGAGRDMANKVYSSLEAKLKGEGIKLDREPFLRYWASYFGGAQER